MQNLCLHCGLSAEGSDFCCAGCETAYRLIHSAGLEAIYSQADRRWTKPKLADSNMFLLFNETSFLDRRAPLVAGYRRGCFKIDGLNCASCVWVIERLSHWHSQIVESRVDFGRSLLTLKWKDDSNILAEVARTLNQLGYWLKPDEITLSSAKISKREWIRLGVSGASAAGAMHIGLILIGSEGTGLPADEARSIGLLAGLTAIPALTFGAAPFFRNAFLGLKMKHLSSDLLISLSVLIGSFRSLWTAYKGMAESYFDALSMIVFLLLCSRILVRLTAINLMTKPFWSARQSGIIVSAETVKIGEVCHAIAEDIIPFDAKVESSDAWVDLSSITGESMPVRVLKGQVIPQGAQANSSFLYTAMQTVAESSFEKLIQNLSSEENTPVHKFDWESLFTSLILILAVFPFIFNLSSALSKAIAVLIVSCPCALQLSKPLVWTSFKREAYKLGIAITHWTRIFNAKKIRKIYFDKTGSLTIGKPSLVREVYQDQLPFTQETLNSLIYETSILSNHPISRTISMAFHERTRTDVRIENLREIAGVGIEAFWNQKKIELKSSHNAESLTTSFWIDGNELCRFYFEDMRRPEVQEVLRALCQDGYEPWVLSGDNQNSVDEFSKYFPELSKRCIGNQTPASKAKYQNAESVFVGDGINDALAMKQAALAIGFCGSAESNLAVADFHLMKHDLRLVPKILRATRRAYNTLILSWLTSLLYNVLVIYLVFAGYLGPILCAIFMPLSSFSVILLVFARKSFCTDK